MRTIVLRKDTNYVWTILASNGTIFAQRRWVYQNEAELWAKSLLSGLNLHYQLEIKDGNLKPPQSPETSST